MKRFQRILSLFLVLLTLLPAAAFAAKGINVFAADYPVEESGRYSTMEEVAVYLATFGKLPSNYITKNEAQSLGWNSRSGNMWKVTDGCSIGGDRFGNYEGLLPDGKWVECDIDFDGGYRNGKRIVFSKDCSKIYYTDDHYNSFTLVKVVFPAKSDKPTEAVQPPRVKEDGLYDTKETVCEYLHQFGHLPDNYITKEEARELGWTKKKDNLGTLLPGASIGGDRFGNNEGLLPSRKDRDWFECDVNTVNGKRGKDRLVYSSDGLIYFTHDGYKTFEQLY